MDPAQAPAAIEFGRFSVLPHRRELLAEGQPLDLGGAALAVLVGLISVSGGIGRDAEVVEIVDLSASHRLVTLTGAGGIGKTRLGFEAARHLLPRFADGVWVVEPAPLSDPAPRPRAVA